MSIRVFIHRLSKGLNTQLLWGACCGTLVTLLAPGCTALHPIRGVPASYLPDQFEGPSRDNKRTIDLSLLVRTPPDQHRVGAGDVLSIYIPRVLGSQSTEVSAVGIEPPINLPSSIEDPPTVGYPITVRDDNTISLPQVPPIPVGGLTLHEVEQTIRKTYTVDHQILNPDEAMVLVSLQRPRIHRVLVVRQEATTSLLTSSMPGTVNIGTAGKGTARIVTLKAYENDVLHALSEGEGVDGLPGLNAENVIYIIRRRPRGFNCPSPIQNSPVIPPMESLTPAPVLPTPAAPPLQMPTTSIQPAAQRGQAVIQRVSYESPVVNPQPYGSYRGATAMPAAMPQSSPIAGGHSAAKPIIPAQYNLLPPEHSQLSENSLPSYQEQIQPQPQPIPTQVDTTPVAPPLVGHSWENLPPELPPEAAPPDALGWQNMLAGFDPTIDNPNVIRIPIRLGPGERPVITEDLITLNDGDIIFIESRETEVFYTAGLLGGGQYTLPRDYDLGVLEAVSIAEGRMGGGGGGSGLNRSIGGVSALNHDVSNSASRLAILRTLPNGKRITIEVDLNKAMRYQQENIRIQPGDILFLEYTLPEAVFAFTQRYLFEGALFSLAASQFNTNR